MKSLFSLLIVFVVGWMGCQQSDPKAVPVAHSDVGSTTTTPASQVDPQVFARYWYSGQGEVNSYELIQWRYDEPRMGEAIMVFVTEPFSATRQVKVEHPDAVVEEVVPVLKLHQIRKFPTGMYDYSMTSSVFMPLEASRYPQVFKLTSSVQEWCGHTFMQFNWKKYQQYRLRAFSYFESEGDRDKSVTAPMFEDEIWTRLRVDPAFFQDGQIIELIPAAHYLRLTHQPIVARQARIRHQDQESGRWLIVEYLHLPRSLRILYEDQFPWRILAWEEEDDGRVSKARMKKAMQLPYWVHHDNDDLSLRDSLALECF